MEDVNAVLRRRKSAKIKVVKMQAESVKTSVKVVGRKSLGNYVKAKNVYVVKKVKLEVNLGLLIM